MPPKDSSFTPEKTAMISNVARLVEHCPALQDATKFLHENSKPSEKAVIILDANDNIELHPALNDKGPALAFTVNINGKTHCCLADISQDSLGTDKNSISLDPVTMQAKFQTMDADADIEVLGYALCDQDTLKNYAFEMNLNVNSDGDIQVVKETISTDVDGAARKKLSDFPFEDLSDSPVTWIKKSQGPLVATLGGISENQDLLDHKFFLKVGAINPNRGQDPDFISARSAKLYREEVEKNLNQTSNAEEKKHVFDSVNKNFNSDITKLEASYKETRTQSKKLSDDRSENLKAQSVNQKRNEEGEAKYKQEQHTKEQNEKIEEASSKANEADKQATIMTSAKIAVGVGISTLMATVGSMFFAAAALGIALKNAINGNIKDAEERATNARYEEDSLLKAQKQEVVEEKIKRFDEVLSELHQHSQQSVARSSSKKPGPEVLAEMENEVAEATKKYTGKFGVAVAGTSAKALKAGYSTPNPIDQSSDHGPTPETSKDKPIEPKSASNITSAAKQTALSALSPVKLQAPIVNTPDGSIGR